MSHTAAPPVDPEWANVFRPEAGEACSLSDELGRIGLFSRLSALERDRLAALVHHRRFAAGETVIRRGAPQSGFYLIRAGSVAILRMADDGHPVELDRLGPGSLVGEFGLLDHGPRSSAVVAAEPAELAGFFAPDLMSLMEVHPDTGCRILLRLGEEMAARLRRDYGELRQRGWSDSPASRMARAEVYTP